MGERVVVNPAATKEPAPAVPLGYGHAEAKFSGVNRAAAQFRDHADGVARRLGGWRRVGFAFGLSCLSAAFAYGIASLEEAGFLAAIGGMLVGFTLPVKGLDDTPRA